MTNYEQKVTSQLATATLKKHGKTFYFAKSLLGKQTGIAAAELYHFCRIIDDLADEATDKQVARNQLLDLRLQIKQRQPSSMLASEILRFNQRWQISDQDIVTLIDGVLMDLEPVALESETDLIRYAFKVAGVVGLMMCPILGAKIGGKPFAVDLGIAMQLTNIARDVQEDAELGRRYIPGEWVNNLSPEQIAHPSIEEKQVIQAAIQRLLKLADSYYQSGFKGLNFLPTRNRLSIEVAGRCYREIGRVVEHNQYRFWMGRAVVSRSRKVVLLSKVVAGGLLNSMTDASDVRRQNHDDRLHRYLADLTKSMSTG